MGMFWVFSYDTRYIDSEFNDTDDSSHYAYVIENYVEDGGTKFRTIDESMTNTTFSYLMIIHLVRLLIHQ